MIYTLFVLLVIVLMFATFFGIKFYRVQSEILSNKRIGFYEYSSYKGKAIVYVRELEMYDNGMSKIKLEKIELVSVSSYYRSDVRNAIKENFASLTKTSNIEWLEIKQTLKDIRREKLKQINKLKK